MLHVSTVATAIRTIVVLFFSWLMVLLVHSQNQIAEISGKTFLFLILSGLATGASWLCYFRALQLGDINKVVPIDKSSTVLTILLAFVFLHEKVGVSNAIGVVDRQMNPNSFLGISRSVCCFPVTKTIPQAMTSTTQVRMAVSMKHNESLTARIKRKQMKRASGE